MSLKPLTQKERCAHKGRMTTSLNNTKSHSELASKEKWIIKNGLDTKMLRED